MSEKKKWDLSYLEEIIKRDSADLIENPEKIHSRCLPKFRCGRCKITIVNSKQFNNMDKYGCICSSCANILATQKRENNCLKEHGCKNPNDIPGVKEKIQATRALNKGEDDLKENAKNMVNARWDKKKVNEVEVEKQGKIKCKCCNMEKNLDCFNKNKKIGYQIICKECYNNSRRRKKNEKNKNNTLEEFLSSILKDAKLRDKKKKREGDLDLEYLLELYKNQNGKCYYSGRVLKYIISKEEHQGKRICPDRISIDRIDSNIGYNKKNIVLCTWTANNLKQDLKIDEFKSIVKDIYNTFVVPV